MRSILKISGAALLVSMISATAFADGPGKGNTGNGNSGLAQGMAGSLSGGNATIGGALGGPGKGTASAVSGDGNGGWGNIGSRSGVAGEGQVSNRDGNRGQ
jgi:hypothetical protein